MKDYAIIAVSPNYWGRGKSVAEAKQELKMSGGEVKGCQLRFVCGDSKPYVNEMGDLIIASDAESFEI